MNAFNYNKLLPRTTTGAALMQNGSLMARFAAPTCWNLLHMAHMDGQLDDKGTTTVFTQVCCMAADVWGAVAVSCIFCLKSGAGPTLLLCYFVASWPFRCVLLCWF